MGSIWGSVGKWFVAGGDCADVYVSNGFHRLRLKPGSEDYLPDIVAGLNTEAYRIQARAFCTGSDGLAELSENDVLEIILPRIDENARRTLQPVVEALLEGKSSVAHVVADLIDAGSIPVPQVRPRASQFVQV